jgi:SSS family solute:Na+ symporter
MAVALVTIARGVPGGFGALLSEAHAQGKFKAFLFDWSFTQPTVWVFTCLAITTVFLQLGDQALMQRALSAPDEKAARNSVLLAGALILPIALMLFFIGTALFVFYRHQPAALDPALPNDSIFPYFVGNELPHGIVGLIMAGIFSAAMSAVSGSVNAISAIVVRDFLMPVRPKITEQARVRAARITTIVAGGLATGIAAIMATMDIRSLWETFAALIALIGGGFPGIFALGLLTRRANAPGVAIGLVASIGITFAIKHYTATNVFLFTSVAVGSCMGVGYVASLFFPPPARSLDGLTVYALRRGREAD